MTTNPFFDLAQTWWDPNGPFATLHDINPCRIQFMQDYFNFSGQRVLDSISSGAAKVVFGGISSSLVPSTVWESDPSSVRCF